MRSPNLITGVILVFSLITTRAAYTEAGSPGYFTNFTVSVSITSAFREFGKPPICIVQLGDNRGGNFAINKTNCDFFLNLPTTDLFSVDLFDISGKPVGKSQRGLQFGLPITGQQIADWFGKAMNRTNRYQRDAIHMICPHESLQVGVFSIPDLFEIKQAGEYTLHVRMRLIMSGQYYAWLPEATGQVRIRPEDIPPLALPQLGQTNTPPK